MALWLLTRLTLLIPQEVFEKFPWQCLRPWNDPGDILIYLFGHFRVEPLELVSAPVFVELSAALLFFFVHAVASRRLDWILPLISLLVLVVHSSGIDSQNR